ncbi:MAG: class I SAM-dependent methyltransferase [Nitrospinae bacterium]|nr:class I SAM-dependent methyltransferase [Nitrospinota bacterium]
MKRIAEPEFMEEAEQVKAYAEADFSTPHDMFVQLFEKKLGKAKGKVLDIGCGTCDVTIRFARAFSSCFIDAIDGGQNMLNRGKEALCTNGMEKHINPVYCKLPSKELNNKKYDSIICNSFLHHLPNPTILWDTIKQVSSPKTSALIMDLMRPSNKNRAKEIVEMYAKDEAEILKTDFYNSLLAAYTVDEIKEQLISAGLNLAVEAATDRHLIIYGRL